MVSTNGKRKTSARKVDHTDLVHTGPGTVAGRFLRRFWQPVYLARELKPGQAVPIRIMSEDFTLYRGESGTPHVVGHRCAHRGTQLSVGWVEGDCIHCFYHGWMYDSSGQCVEQPAESEAFARKVKIGGHPTQEYLGLIFAYFGEGEAPPFPTYRDFEDEGFHTARTYTRGCNYFNNIDNHSDEVHVTFTHRESAISVIADIFQVRAEETEYGTVNYFTRANGMGHETHCIMPNLLQWVSMLPFTNEAEAQQVGWVDSLAWRVPSTMRRM